MQYKLLATSLLLVLILLVLPLVSSGELRVTKEHPFLLANGSYVPAKDLKVGDKLMKDDGTTAVVTFRKSVVLDKPVKVYNLEVSWPSTFFANGILVHNKAKPDRPKLGPIYDDEKVEIGNLIHKQYGVDYNDQDPLQVIGMRANADKAKKALIEGISDWEPIYTFALRGDDGKVKAILSYHKTAFSKAYEKILSKELGRDVEVLEIGLFASESRQLEQYYFDLVYELLKFKKSESGSLKNIVAINLAKWKHGQTHIKLLNRLANEFRPNCKIARDGSYVLDLPDLDIIALKRINNVKKNPDGKFLIDDIYYQGEKGHLQLSVNIYDNLEIMYDIFSRSCK